MIRDLRIYPFASLLGLVLNSSLAKEGISLIDKGLALADQQTEKAYIDSLAADYADIYLTHRFRASPYESVWLDEDHLERQEAMFSVRAWYKHYEMVVKNWRDQPDDHIALQLEFAAHLLCKEAAVPIEEVARFLDEHLLLWIHAFAERVVDSDASSFYKGLAMLTVAYLNEQRNMITAMSGYARPELLSSGP